MYEKEIKQLAPLRFGDEIDNATEEAIGEAIELMRAAEPKDEAAERDHCRETIAGLSFYDGRYGFKLASMLLRERAAARAEGAALRDSERKRAMGAQTMLALLGCIEATELHGWWHLESTRADLLAFAAAVRAELEGRCGSVEALFCEGK